MQRRDPGALEELYALVSRRAFGLALRILRDEDAAADVVQEAFVAIWEQSDRLDRRRGRAQSLLLTMVHHRAVDALRSQTRRRARTQPFDAHTDSYPDDNWDALLAATASDDALRAIEGAFPTLPAEQREVLELVYFEGLSQVEASERLSIPLGTAKSRLRLGMEKLRLALGVVRP